MGEGGWDSWPGEGRWYQCLACVFSICPFVASGGGGREGAELGGGVSPGLAASWQLQLSGGEDTEGSGGSERAQGAADQSQKKHIFFSFPIEGLIQGPLIEE